MSTSALALGRETGAEAAMKQLLDLDSDPRWFRLRAHAAYRVGHYPSIVRDTRTYVDRFGWADESAPHLAFLAAIANWRLSRPADADAILTEAAAGVRKDSWQERILLFMRGQLTADVLVSRAKNVDERTEAHAYAGIKATLAGRLDAARQHLQWVKDRGSRNFSEYSMAIAELKRLNAGK